MDERVIGLKEAKKPFTVMIILLVISVLIGAFLVKYAFDSGAIQLEDILNAISKFMSNVGITPDTSSFMMFIRILMNNARVVFISIVLGLIPFLMLPSVIIFMNGLVLGAAFTVFTYIFDMGSAYFFAAILPHGVLEMLVFCFSSAIGVKLSLELGRIIRGKSHTTVRDYSLRVVKTFILVILPLIILAAFIESYVTPLVLGLVT